MSPSNQYRQLNIRKNDIDMKKRYAGAILGITLGTMSVGSAYLPAAQMMAMAAESSTAESDTEETEAPGTALAATIPAFTEWAQPCW